MSDSSFSRTFYPFTRQFQKKNRNENNENTDYLIQTSIKINVRDLSRIKQFEYDPKHCYSFQECKDERRNNKLEACLIVHLPHEM